MRNYHDENLLVMVEMYAEEVGNIASEDELSERFDEMLKCFPDFPLGDGPALLEAFNRWSDGLCRDGEIHPEQRSHYRYVGAHS